MSVAALIDLLRRRGVDAETIIDAVRIVSAQSEPSGALRSAAIADWHEQAKREAAERMRLGQPVNPRAMGVNPRALGTNPRSKRHGAFT